MVVPTTPVYWYLIPIICMATAVVVTVKVMISYRVLVINGERWKVNRIGSTFSFNTKDISWWKLTTIKTGGGIYEELQIQASTGKGKYQSARTYGISSYS